MKSYFLVAMIALQTLAVAHAAAEKKTVQLIVTEKGFEPDAIKVAPDTELTLSITRKTDVTCAREITIPAKNIKKKELPLNKAVTINLGQVKKGDITFSCSMDMVTGVINVK